MKTSDFKEHAKNALKGKWGVAIGAFLIFSIVSGLSGMIPERYSWVSPIIFVLITAPLSVGYAWFSLDVKRTDKPEIETIFAGFSKGYVRNVLASVSVSVFTFLWSLLLIVPGVIKALSYSMTFYILKDRPELSAYEAITESRKMMDGKKKQLFYLVLSFIVWYLIPIALYLVSAITLSMVYFGNSPVAWATTGLVCFSLASISLFAISFYVTPYYMTSVATFYDDYAKLETDEAHLEHPNASGH